MLNKLFDRFKNLFAVKSYGDSLKDYIVKNNPKNNADVEVLERQWLYKQKKHTGGQWL